MSQKRKDSKGRILRDGEFQRDDGRYEYKYTDINGMRRSVYSWRLVSTDRVPEGKRDCKPLRDMIKTIQKDLDDGIDAFSVRKITVNDCFEQYIRLTAGIKEKSRQQYIRIYDHHVRPVIGSRKIADIKYADIRKMYQDMLLDKGLKINTIISVDTVVNPVFSFAVRNEIIRNNPVRGVAFQLKKAYGLKQEKKRSLSVKEQTVFLQYVRETTKYKKWIPLFLFLFGTGCRIGEALALQWEDCAFDEDMIYIRHTLSRYKNDEGAWEKYLTTPKTDAGIRTIPMIPEVKSALILTLGDQLRNNIAQKETDGYSNFVFTSIRNEPLEPNTVGCAIRAIVKKYNETEEAMSERENREPFYLPAFSPHIMRHTFCVRLCESETNLKVIQEVMGHSDIATTMNIYNEANADLKKETFQKIETNIDPFRENA